MELNFGTLKICVKHDKFNVQNYCFTSCVPDNIRFLLLVGAITVTIQTRVDCRGSLSFLISVMNQLLKLRLKLAGTGLALSFVAIGTYLNCIKSLKPDPFLDAEPSKSVVSKL